MKKTNQRTEIEVALPKIQFFTVFMIHDRNAVAGFGSNFYCSVSELIQKKTQT